jgi:CarboxypepD_reg-like domain
MKLKLFLLIPAFSYSVFCLAQKIEVKGKITDTQSAIPLSGVSVSIAGNGTTTNNNGFFSLKIESELAEKNSLTISHIGYEKRTFDIQVNRFYLIELMLTKITLSEVVISSGAEKILRKAIERIPVNYPTNEFEVNGILRIYRTETDSPKIYRFFKSDAVLRLQYPSYLNPEKDVAVKVIQNRTVYLKPLAAPYDSSIWFGAYNMHDFVQKRTDFINIEELDKFNYHIDGKTSLQGTTVWVINFESKQKNHARGTIFIDTATYAFVAAKYSRFNIIKLRRRTIDEGYSEVLFQNINGKWYLQKKTNHIKYRFSKATRILHTDFISADINENLKVIPFKKNEIVNTNDEDQKLIKHLPDSSWHYFDSLFKKAEEEHAILYIPVPKPNINPGNATAYDEDEIPFHKRIDYLENTKVRLCISMDFINIRSSANSKGSSGIGFGTGVKLFPNTYLHLLAAINFKDANRITTSKTGLGLLHSINISKRQHVFYITPLIAVNFVELYSKKEHYKKFFELTGGVGISYPIIPKIRPFLNLCFNKIFYEKGKLATYYTGPVTFSFGTFYIF